MSPVDLPITAAVAPAVNRNMEVLSSEVQPRTFTIKLWPPSHSTRLAIIERITKNLTAENVFSRKYGLLTTEEAAEEAKDIEESSFTAAEEHYKNEPDGDGSSAVQLYAKESSNLMIRVLKRGPRAVKPPKAVAPIKPAVFDISGGKRALIDADEASQLLGPLAEEGNSFTKICFSNRSFGIEAARVAGPILRSVSGKLTEVDLSDFVASRPEEEALEVMRVFADALAGAKLQYLNLSDNALGEKGVRAFGPLLKSQSGLEELYLINNGISGEAAMAVAELLPDTGSLRVLQFHNNMSGDEGAAAIAGILRGCPNLTDFRCSSTRVGSEGGSQLAAALATCTHLKKLDLRDNMFGVDAAKTLSETLLSLTELEEIYLSYLNLEDEGAAAVFKALEATACPLGVLEVAGNEITAKSAAALAATVSSKDTLVKLIVSENSLKDEGAIVLAKALETGNSSLKELDLSSNFVRQAGAKCLARVAASRTAFSLLNVNDNAISEEGLDEVREILKKGKSSVDVLGPLDENDPERESEEEEEEEEEERESELESKLKGLGVDQ